MTHVLHVMLPAFFCAWMLNFIMLVFSGFKSMKRLNQNNDASRILGG